MSDWPPEDPRRSPIMLRRQLIGGGYTDRGIARLVAEGTLHRVRHGAYVDGAAWRVCEATGRHAIRGRAVLAQARAEVVLSHLSAATEWDVPTWDLDVTGVDVHLTRVDQRAGRREAGVVQHLGELRKQDTVSRNGVVVTSPTRTALDTASLMGVELGLTTVNDLLHRGLTTMDDLRASREQMSRWPSSLHHGVVMMLADGRCESVGESRCLFLFFHQGLPRPEVQYKIYDRCGTLVAVVDFAWPDLGLFGEFDGKIKYQALLKEGESPTDVVLREKRREELVGRITGWRCVRIDWSDLYRPERTADVVRRLFRPAAHMVSS